MSYVDIKKVVGGIKLILTKIGAEELDAHRIDRTSYWDWDKGAEEILRELLDDHLCNGWEFVPPEDIGALTSSPILSDEVERNDDGEIVKVGKVYWFPNYAVQSELDLLYDDGEVFFPEAEAC